MMTSPVSGAKRTWSGRTRNSLSILSSIPHTCEINLPSTDCTPWPRRNLSSAANPFKISPGARKDELVSIPTGSVGVSRYLSNRVPSAHTLKGCKWKYCYLHFVPREAIVVFLQGKHLSKKMRKKKRIGETNLIGDITSELIKREMAQHNQSRFVEGIHWPSTTAIPHIAGPNQAKITEQPPTLSNVIHMFPTLTK